ncbi:hypothetical protein C8R44DRAFT_724856 [Mycena epipterygia]|nr:hypothetical protein C8R44DRAFT_724856 [Mycena epipterygia]
MARPTRPDAAPVQEACASIAIWESRVHRIPLALELLDVQLGAPSSCRGTTSAAIRQTTSPTFKLECKHKYLEHIYDMYTGSACCTSRPCGTSSLGCCPSLTLDELRTCRLSLHVACNFLGQNTLLSIICTQKVQDSGCVLVSWVFAR